MKVYEELLDIQLKRINHYLKEYELQVNRKGGFFYEINIVYKDKTGLHSKLIAGLTKEQVSTMIDCIERIASLMYKQE